MSGITDPSEEYFKNGLWAWVTGQWKKLIGDDAGHLQVDVVESGLPSGAATSAKQDTLAGYVDGIEGLLAGGLPSALDTDNLKVKEQSPLTGFATSAHQTTMITALQLIDDLRAALTSVASDSLDVRLDGQTADVEIKQTAAADLTPGIEGWDGAAWRKLPMLWGYSERWAEDQNDASTSSATTILTTSAVPAGHVYVLQAIHAVWTGATCTGIGISLYSAVYGASLLSQASPVSARAELWSGSVCLAAGDVLKGLFYGLTNGDAVDMRLWGYKMKVAE